MHRPAGETCDMPVLSFAEALVHDGSADYDREKWLYVPDFYSEYRYILGLRGERPLITIGVNPSTAKPDDLDNTLKSVERVAAHNGFSGFTMFNVYAQRATDPNDMDRIFNRTLHAENMRAFTYVLGHSGPSPVIWAAWGAVIEKRGYLKTCLKDMLDIGGAFSAKWVCAGPCSKKGHPHHPLYLKKDSPLAPFDMEKYLTLL